MIIKVENLYKSYQSHIRRQGLLGNIKDLFQREYKEIKAVDGISFEVKPGELLGFIGPNGAGKSTTIKMLTGILKPTSGRIEVAGFEPFSQRREYTKKIGVVFGQRTQLWWDIAVIESFNLLAKIYAVSKSDYENRLNILKEILGLSEFLHTPVRKLSLGQRMRCDLAASLLHNPPLLFLDEPTIGLDLVAKDSIREFLHRINKEFGTTILLTTHDLKEIEQLCSRIIIIDKGHLIYNGSIEKIRNMPGLKRHLLVDFPGAAPLEELRSAFNSRVTFTKESERRLIADFDPHNMPTVELIKEVVKGYDISDLTVTEPSIEDVISKIYREGVKA